MVINNRLLLVDPATGAPHAGPDAEKRHVGDHMTRFPPEKGEAMTAVSLFCRFFMGQDPKEKPTMKAIGA